MPSIRGSAEFFAANGYLLVHDVFSPSEVEFLSDCYGQVVERERAAGKMANVSGQRDGQSAELYQVRMAHLQHPAFSMLLHDSRLLDIAELLLGPDLTVLHCQGVYKPPGTGGSVPWHQDNFYLRVAENLTVAVWIALDDATVESGCMWYRPRAHFGLIEHRKVWDPAERRGFYFEIPESDLAGEEIPIELPRGSVAVHHALMPHRSGPNRTANPRRSLTIHLMSSQAAHDGHLKNAPSGILRQVRHAR